MTGPGDRAVRTAVIGYGLGGETFHAPFVATTPGLRLAAVVTGRPDRRQAVLSRYLHTEVIGSTDELFARADDFDLVVITTPNRFHVPLAKTALTCRLHVVVDKPFAATADKGRAVMDLAAQQGRMVCAFQNRRWDGDFLTVRKLMSAGRLGRVQRFESRFERWRPQPQDGWKADADPEAMGGTLYDLGSHLIDQAVALFGRPARVYAELNGFGPDAVVDDDAFVALNYADGMRCHLYTSTTTAHLGPRFRVLGSQAAYVKHDLDVQEGQLRAGAMPGDVEFGDEPEAAWGVLGNATDGFEPVATRRGDYPAFYVGVAAAVRGAAEPPVPVQDTLTVLEVVDAARLSARTGDTMRL